MADSIYIPIAFGMIAFFLVIVAFLLITSRSKNRLLMQKQASQRAEIAHQKELLSAVIESQEAERKRVGRDLHDDVGTALSSLRLVIDMSKPTFDEGGHKVFVSSIKTVIDKVIKDVRGISHNLSPTTLSYYGLVAAVEEHCNIINQSGKMAVELSNHAPDVVSSLSLSVSTALYRVLEELLNNTIKHANATKTMISFAQQGEMLFIAYQDNGKGMGAETEGNKGMGLQNIESRLNNIEAAYVIETAVGKGFKIEIQYKIK